MNIQIFQPFFISLLLGALLGFERTFTTREKQTEGDIVGGIRTYSLISLLGCVSAFIHREYVPGFLLVSYGALAGLVLIIYFLTFYKYDERGATTEVSMLLCFTLGVMVSSGLYVLSTAVAIVIMAVLYLKDYMSTVSGRLERADILAVIKFSIITFVILPVFDPSMSVKVGDIAGTGWDMFKAYPDLPAVPLINPHNVWLMVVLISGIGFTGYVSIKILGSRKGIGLTGLLGGLVSSTATTLTFAKRSVADKGLSLSFALAVLLACSTMFPRVLVEVAVINPALIKSLAFTMGIMAVTGFSVCLVIWRITGREETDDVPLANPFNIMPAVKFGLLYAVIVLITRFAGVIAGDGGVYVVSILSGLTDVDAITLTMSQISKQDPSKADQAAVAITLAAFSNTAMKAVMACMVGSEKFRKVIVVGFACIIGAGAAGLMFI